MEGAMKISELSGNQKKQISMKTVFLILLKLSR